MSDETTKPSRLAEARIHDTAVVDWPASIGAGTSIWHFCHIMSGARIGERCVLGQNVYVASSVVLGDGCRVQNNVSLFDGVHCADEVFLGPSVTFTNVRYPRAHISRRDGYEPTRVGTRASIGANTTIRCGVTVGAYALIGSGAVVTRDVAPHALVVGVPGCRVGWVCRCGVPFAEAEASTLTCSVCAWEVALTTLEQGVGSA